jgi:hypothetical protein
VLEPVRGVRTVRTVRGDGALPTGGAVHEVREVRAVRVRRHGAHTSTHGRPPSHERGTVRTRTWRTARTRRTTTQLHLGTSDYSVSRAFFASAA